MATSYWCHHHTSRQKVCQPNKHGEKPRGLSRDAMNRAPLESQFPLLQPTTVRGIIATDMTGPVKDKYDKLIPDSPIRLSISRGSCISRLTRLLLLRLQQSSR
jgi:hypothetical protein